MKKNTNFTFETITEEEKLILSLTEEQKSEFVFNEEPLYILGRGHSFLNGFFLEYITKTGITAWCFSPELWVIGGKNYEFKNNEFVKKIEIERTPINSSTFKDFFLPNVNNTSSKLLAEELISVKPSK